jgi:hypothetical protein
MALGSCQGRSKHRLRIRTARLRQVKMQDMFFLAGTVDATERRRLWAVIVALLLVISLPYAWAAAITPDGFEYFGLLYNPDDQNVHLAWARQAQEGHFFFRDLFTTEALTSGERPLFTNLFCWLMGIVSALTHLPLIWIYHAFRLMFAALAMLWFYALCAALTPDRRIRLIALLLAAFSSGAGWLRPIFPTRILIDRPDLLNFPMMPEAFTFSSAFIFPLYIASMAFLPLIYLLTWRARATGDLRYAVGAGCAALLLANIHTYDVLPLNATLLLWAIWSTLPLQNKRQARNNSEESDAPQQAKNGRAHWLAPLIVILFTLPPLIYQWLVFRDSDEFRIKALTPTPAPPLPDILLSYGPLMLLAALGAVVSRRDAQTRQGTLLMTMWAGVTLLLIYAPVSFARKMIEGLHLPLCFLGAVGLGFLLSRVRVPASFPRLRHIVAALAVALMCISSVQFVMWCLWNKQDNNFTRGVPMPPLSLTSGDAAALRFLDQVPAAAQPRAGLSLIFAGNYVPRETGLHAYLGHWAETLHIESKPGQEGKYSQASRFYTGQMPEAEARALLRNNHIGYVMEGFYEKAIAQQAGAPLPSARLQLPKLFEQNGTAIYAVPYE